MKRGRGTDTQKRERREAGGGAGPGREASQRGKRGREAGDNLRGRGQWERGPLPPEYKMRGTGVGCPGLEGQDRDG